MAMAVVPRQGAQPSGLHVAAAVHKVGVHRAWPGGPVSAHMLRRTLSERTELVCLCAWGYSG